MDIWLSFLVVFYVVNSSLAVSRPEEKNLIYDMFSNVQNEVIKLIWEQEPVTFCKIMKPSENSSHDKAFLTYNFNDVLCVVLSDASLRYLNFSSYLRDEKELFGTIAKDTPAPKEFCNKMKTINWTTNIEENVSWLQEFNNMMNNETLCRRYCVADFINPMCSYTLWLEELIKEGERRRELQQKIEASRSPPIPFGRLGVSSKPPMRQGLPRVSPPQSLANHGGSPSILAPSPSDLQVDHRSSAHFTDSAVALGVDSVKTDVTNQLTSKTQEHSLEDTLPKTSNMEGGNEQNKQQNYSAAVNIDLKPKNGPKPYVPTDRTMEGKPHVSVSNPIKTTKGGSVNPKNFVDEVSGRGQDTHTQSKGSTSRNMPRVELEKDRLEDKQNFPASVAHTISTTNHNDKGKLVSAPVQMPKHGADVKPAESVGTGKTEDFTLENKERVAGTDPKTFVEPEDKEAVNEGIPEESVQLEPNNHEQKDREDAVGGEDTEALEHPEEQSPEGDLATAEPRFGGEIEDPANGHSTSPKNFEYDSEDDPILPINGVEQEKVTQNDAGAGMYVHDRFVDAEDSHFFAYFMTMIILCILGYLIFHNKQKILALALEGRARKGNRRRPSTSGYRKLDSNLEEAVTSNCAGASVTHVIY